MFVSKSRLSCDGRNLDRGFFDTRSDCISLSVGRRTKQIPLIPSSLFPRLFLFSATLKNDTADTCHFKGVNPKLWKMKSLQLSEI